MKIAVLFALGWSLLAAAIPLAASRPLFLEVRANAAIESLSFFQRYVDTLMNELLEFLYKAVKEAAGEYAGIDHGDMVPIHAVALLNPSYANYSDHNWNARFLGRVYKRPPLSREKLDALTNKFLIGTTMEKLPVDQADRAREMGKEVFVVPHKHQDVVVQMDHYSTNASVSGKTSTTGEFDFWARVQHPSLHPGTFLNIGIQRFNFKVRNYWEGYATTYFVPPQGLTVISDVDDILRESQVWKPNMLLLKTFALPFLPWINIPSIYKDWAQVPGIHFHYLTTSPQPLSRRINDFLNEYYPHGSLDTRPLDWNSPAATLHTRVYHLETMFETFPERKFVLVGDTSNLDALNDYPTVARRYPDQIQCIFIRVVEITDPSDKVPWSTKHFHGIPKSKYMFFNVPDDLRGLNIANGECVNDTVKVDINMGEFEMKDLNYLIRDWGKFGICAVPHLGKMMVHGCEAYWKFTS